MSKVCHNCLAEIGRNPGKREELRYKEPLNNKDLTPHKCYSKMFLEKNHIKDIVPARPPEFADVADPTLVAVLAQLSDSIRLLTLAQLASNEIESNEIRSKIRSG